MQIDWWTLALQAINFLVLVWLLRRFLYRPVMDVIEKRKQLAERAFAEAGEEKTQAEAARQQFEQSQAGLASERKELLKKVHQEIEAERRQILDDARKDAERLLQNAHDSIAEEREATLAEMRDQVADLAADLAAELLRETGSEATNGTFLERLERQMNELPASELKRLQGDLGADGTPLTVVTAAALSSAEQEQWTKRLGACLGQKTPTTFEVEPEILGGAELRFPHAVLKFTWADQLAKAKELMHKNETAT